MYEVIYQDMNGNDIVESFDNHLAATHLTHALFYAKIKYTVWHEQAA
jgi:hypothetical protein